MPGDVGQPADTVAQRARACDAQGDARSDELEPLACISTRLSGGQHSVGTRLCAKHQPQRVASGLRLVFDTAALQSGEKCTEASVGVLAPMDPYRNLLRVRPD